MDASLIALEGNAATVGAPKGRAYAAASILREFGAPRVDSVTPDMLYGAGADVFERVRGALG